jgi:DNA-binding response OmpR family regulator
MKMAHHNNSIEGSLILVVEDNASLLRDVAFVLEVAGFNVMSVSSGEAALKLMKRQTPDLVISDVDMPGMDGYEFLRQLRADKKSAFTPCILTSERYAYDDLMNALDLGANEFLPKPFDAYELIDAIYMVLGETFTFKQAAG